jgi:hypothetical protein
MAAAAGAHRAGCQRPDAPLCRPPLRIGASPSGKAAVFGTAIPRFESWRPSQQFQRLTEIRAFAALRGLPQGYRSARDLSAGRSGHRIHEALDVAILARAARSDVGGLGSDRRVPLLDGLGEELRAIVGSSPGRELPELQPLRLARADEVIECAIVLGGKAPGSSNPRDGTFR